MAKRIVTKIGGNINLVCKTVSDQLCSSKDCFIAFGIGIVARGLAAVTRNQKILLLYGKINVKLKHSDCETLNL